MVKRTSKTVRSASPQMYQPPEAILLLDNMVSRVPASQISRTGRGDAARDAQIAHLFLERNRDILSQFEIESRVDFDGSRVYLVIRTGNHIGAFPLVSPMTGKPEVSVIVRPRLGWMGLGKALGICGFKVLPQVLQYSMLPKTEREIPLWVLSAAVLPRIKGMLDRCARSFEMVQELRAAPRGGVDWSTYALQSASTMNFLRVPCRFPDLRRNREMWAAVHFTLRKQLAALQSQRHTAGVVLVLMDFCLELLRQVQDVAAVAPTKKQLEAWIKTPMSSAALLEGLNAITWTIDETGLGGVTDWRGLPWAMSMDQFFEAWVETVLERYTRRSGGLLHVGRRRETIRAIGWDRAFMGSQKYLMPDLVIEQEDRMIFVDAKYKDHWEDLRERGWANLEQEIHERHRSDLLQVLAYSTLSDKKSTTACLAYPCKPETWKSLRDRDLLSHKASISAGHRRVDLVLTAMPIGQSLEEVVEGLRSALAA